MTIPANFTARKMDSQAPTYWWLDIVGLRVRYGTRAPSWTPADSGTNRPVKAWLSGMPSYQAQKANPLDGSCDPHGFEVTLLDVDDELTDLFATSKRSATTYLTADLAAAAVTATVEDSSVFSLPCDLYLDDETVRATAAPTGTTLTIERGMYGSEDRDHDITDSQGNDRLAMLTDRPTFIIGREAVLYETRHSLVEDDAISMRCVIDDVQDLTGAFSLSARGMLSLLEVQIGDTLAVTTLTAFFNHGLWLRVGNASAFQSSGIVQVGEELIRYVETNTVGDQQLRMVANADMPEGDGEAIEALSYRSIVQNRGILSAEIYPPELAFVTAPDSDSPVTYPRFMIDHEPGEEVRDVISHESFTGGTDPISVALQFMLSKTGDGSNHATYDTLPEGWGAGIDASKVDVAGMVEMGIATGVISHGLQFYISESVDLDEWLRDNIFRPCLLFPCETLDGVITLKRVMTLQEAAQDTSVTLDASVYDAPPQPLSMNRPFGEFTFKCNYYPPTDEYIGEARILLGDSWDVHRGRCEKFELESPVFYDNTIGAGLKTWSSNQIAGLPSYLRQYIGPIWQRYSRNPCPRFKVRVPINRATDFQVGAICQLTSAMTGDPKTGTRGISAEYCQVMQTRMMPSQSAVELEIWYISVHDNNANRIAPSAVIDSYTDIGGGHSEITIKSTYGAAYADWSDDDEVFFVDTDLVPLAGATPEIITVEKVGAAKIQIETPTNVPSAGDIMETAPYDSAVTAQQDAWSFMADASDTLGAASDDGNERI